MQSDGVDAVETDASNCMNLPVEALEMDIPIRVHRFALRPDSGGAGCFRGGLGTIREYEILDGGDVVVTHRGERHFIAAQGSSGGGPGARARSVIRHADGREDVIPSKQVTTLRPGDRLVVELAGGGGFGDPRARDRSATIADVRDGKVSREAAHAVYGLDD